MANAKIDQNDIKTWTAYNDTTGLIENVRVDPIFGALEVYFVNYDGGVPTTLNTARIDQNHAKTKLLYNNTTGLVEAMRCGSGGELLIIE